MCEQEQRHCEARNLQHCTCIRRSGWWCMVERGCLNVYVYKYRGRTLFRGGWFGQGPLPRSLGKVRVWAGNEPHICLRCTRLYHTLQPCPGSPARPVQRQMMIPWQLRAGREGLVVKKASPGCGASFVQLLRMLQHHIRGMGGSQGRKTLRLSSRPTGPLCRGPLLHQRGKAMHDCMHCRHRALANSRDFYMGICAHASR
jgi:hypothetical protein